MTKKAKVYVVGRGYIKPEKLIAEELRQQEVAAMRSDAHEARIEKATNLLRAEHYLEKAFKWQKIGNTKSNYFYSSGDWAKVRYAALINYGGRCACCGSSAADGLRMHVDHIKPRSKFPELALDLKNLQVLCETCNLAKSNIDDTDWRKSGMYDGRNFDEYSDANLSAFLSSL